MPVTTFTPIQISQLHAQTEQQEDNLSSPSLIAAAVFTIVSFLYWYYLIFGAAAAANNLPFIPSFLPLTPGWPPTDADLAPAIQDSSHFFYISDVIQFFTQTTEATPPPQLRLALFNIAEAWIFAFLPLLLQDKKRLPLPVLLFTYLGGLGLTNAFLAPYIAVREILQPKNEENNNAPSTFPPFLTKSVGIITTIVVMYASIQILGVILTNNETKAIEEFITLVRSDRTYLAFCIDLILFGMFQAWLMKDGVMNDDTNGNIPLIGLIGWILKDEK